MRGYPIENATMVQLHHHVFKFVDAQGYESTEITDKGHNGY